MKTMDNHALSRRHFIRQAACASLGALSLVNTLAALRLTSAAMAQSTNLSDYKALVCIFLYGGNDANNLLIPAGDSATNPIRADYEAGRTGLSLSNGLQSLNVPATTSAFKKYYNSGTSPMATHPNTPEIAQLFNAGELAFVCNVGSLSYPIPTREDYIQKRVPLPPNLYSHNSQQMQWQTSVPDNPLAVGWGGRLSDLLHSAYNADTSNVSMSISLDGVNTFQSSALPETAAFAMNNQGVNPINGFHSGGVAYPGNYNNAYEEGATFANPQYKDTLLGHRLRAMDRLMTLTSENLLEEEYIHRIASARELEDTVGASLSIAQGNGIDYDTTFTDAQTSLGDQLKMVAQLIAGRSALGNQRQIFLVGVGGYDLHQNHLPSHHELLGELSRSMMAFRNAMIEADDWDKVVAFTATDFARTFTVNSPDGNVGTDHAWGNHAMVMGGPVKGGDLYGHFPSLKLGDQSGSIDAHSGRGRWIPSVSVDQYGAVMAKWFGVDSNSMETIFPNLPRFNDPFTAAEPNLGFI